MMLCDFNMNYGAEENTIFSWYILPDAKKRLRCENIPRDTYCIFIEMIYSNGINSYFFSLLLFCLQSSESFWCVCVGFALLIAIFTYFTLFLTLICWILFHNAEMQNIIRYLGRYQGMQLKIPNNKNNVMRSKQLSQQHQRLQQKRQYK